MEENVNNPAAIQVLARSLNLLIKIFYDLNWHVNMPLHDLVAATAL